MKWLQIVGIISYSLYLWQQMFTAQTNLYLVHGWWNLPPLMLLAAAASYYWVEKPCIKLGKTLLPNIHTKAQPAAQAIQPQLGAVGKSLGN